MNVLAYVHLRNIHRSTGAGRVARQLMEQMRQYDDVQLRILADSDDFDRIIPEVGAPWTQFRYHFFQSGTSTQQARWLFLGSPTAESFWPNVDIVHCTGESYVPTRRSRLVVTVHDAAYFEPGAHEASLRNTEQRLKWRLLYSKLARKTDAFHTVSKFSADRLGELFPSIRGRLHVVPNAVCRQFFGTVTEAGRQFIEEAGLLGRNYILVPGGLHFRKNADLVLKAWPLLSQRFPAITLVVSGHNTPRYEAIARTMQSTLKLTGFVVDPELHALYAGASVVWFPSLYEGFGIPVLEAMAAGAAVVASNSTSLPEIAGGAALLVSPRSVSDNIEAVACLLDDSAQRRQLVQRGREHASKYTWESSGRELHALYQHIV